MLISIQWLANVFFEGSTTWFEWLPLAAVGQLQCLGATLSTPLLSSYT